MDKQPGWAIGLISTSLLFAGVALFALVFVFLRSYQRPNFDLDNNSLEPVVDESSLEGESIIDRADSSFLLSDEMSNGSFRTVDINRFEVGSNGVEFVTV
jgi:hypothetical protein